MFLPGFDAPSATGGPDCSASRMIDSYGRAVSYLRLSVTDRCDCRCIYCMPERMSFLPNRTIFSPRQLRPGGAVLVASGDRDSFQLASDSTKILYPVRAGEMARIGPEEVRKRYGVDPKQVPDFIALRGDPSDKIPGAAGVGPKGAADLLRRYGTLEGVLDAGRFPTQAKMLRLYRSIATMDASAPLPSLADQAPTWAVASELARSWGLRQLADRLSERA